MADDEAAARHQVMLERDIAPLGEPFLDSLQPPLFALDQIGVWRAYAREFHCVPLREDFRHRRGHRVLRLLRIPAREDDVRQQRLIGNAEELLESSRGRRRLLAHAQAGLAFDL